MRFAGFIQRSAFISYNKDWFLVKSVVRQGYSLSLIHFALFNNDLASDLHNLGKGIKIRNFTLPILMYADDIVILSDTHQERPGAA